MKEFKVEQELSLEIFEVGKPSRQSNNVSQTYTMGFFFIANISYSSCSLLSDNVEMGLWKSLKLSKGFPTSQLWEMYLFPLEHNFVPVTKCQQTNAGFCVDFVL